MAARLLLLVAALLLVGCGDDATRPHEDPTFGTEREILDAGAVRLFIDNRGSIGRSSTDLESIGSFPAGSPNNYLLSSGLWAGGVVRGGPVVSTAAEYESSTSEFLPGRRSGQGIGGGRILCSDRSADLEHWYPEFRDATTGAPLLLGDEDCVVIFHDGNQSRDVRTPIGLEVRQHSVSFTSGLASQAVVFVWELETSGLEPLTDAYAAVFVDVDIGAGFSDDRCSVILEVPPGPNNPLPTTLATDLFFCWDHDFHESSFDPNPPGFLGVSFLRVPPEIGPRKLTRATQTGPSFAEPLPPDPEFDAAQHELLVGTAVGRIPFLPDRPRDVRAVAVTGPFTLSPGIPRRLAVAYLWADVASPIDLLEGSAAPCFGPFLCFLPDPNDSALAELIAVQQAVQQLVDERLPAP